MGLTHVHSKDGKGLPKLDKEWTSISSKRIAISLGGGTLVHCEFSACLAVVMSGAGKWSAVAHMLDVIQWEGKSLTRALALVADFVCKEVKGDITDVLLYFGNPGENMGQHQIAKGASLLTAANVKSVMGCKNVIDLRRMKNEFTWGNDFVYDPGKKCFYTAPGGDRTAHALMLEGNKKQIAPSELKFRPFPFDKGVTKDALDSVAGMADNGYCILR